LILEVKNKIINRYSLILVRKSCPNQQEFDRGYYSNVIIWFWFALQLIGGLGMKLRKLFNAPVWREMILKVLPERAALFFASPAMISFSKFPVQSFDLSSADECSRCPVVLAVTQFYLF